MTGNRNSGVNLNSMVVWILVGAPVSTEHYRSTWHLTSSLFCLSNLQHFCEVGSVNNAVPFTYRGSEGEWLDSLPMYTGSVQSQTCGTQPPSSTLGGLSSPQTLPWVCSQILPAAKGWALLHLLRETQLTRIPHH